MGLGFMGSGFMGLGFMGLGFMGVGWPLELWGVLPLVYGDDLGTSISITASIGAYNA